MRAKVKLAIIALCLLVPAAAASAQSEKIIYTTTGEKFTGRIQKQDKKFITMKLKGGVARIPASIVKKITDLIAEAASIHSLVQQLDKTKKEVGPEVASLLRYQKRLEHDNFYLEHINQQCLNAHIQMAQQDEELTSQIEPKRARLNKLEQLISAHVSEVLIASWVIGFLAKPENLYDSGFEEFMGKLLSIRKHLDGIEPKCAVQDGQTYCLFPAPQGVVDISKYNVDPGEARKMLAHLLVPLVNDKFMPRFEYEMGKAAEGILELKKELWSLK